MGDAAWVASWESYNRTKRRENRRCRNKKEKKKEESLKAAARIQRQVVKGKLKPDTIKEKMERL